MFIIRFLQSLIIPSKMERYKKMPIFIAIAIFFLSSGLLSLPNIINISNNRKLLVDEQDSYNLSIFSNIKDEDFKIIKNSTGTVKNQLLKLENNTSIVNGEHIIFDVIYQEEEAQIYIVFDLFDIHDSEAKPSYDIQTMFKPIQAENPNSYLLIFFQDGVRYITPSFEKDLNYAKGKDFNFIDLASGQEFAYRMIDMYMEDIRLELSFQTFLICVVYPLILIIVMWLIYKTTQTSYTFKEMYNIASIASIIPLLIVIILAILLPNKGVIYYYLSIFGFYYIIVLHLISSKKKLV